MLLTYRVVDDKKAEILDIVDENDNVVGQESRESFRDKAFNPQGKFARIVNCFIINSHNKIWCPIRSANKRSFPNSMDFSCGGYVQSGETYQEAMIAELKEENNLDVKPEELSLIAKLTPKEDGLNVFMGLYKVKTDNPITYSQKDFSEAEWLTVDQIIEKLKKGFPAKNHLLPVLLKFKDQL